MISFFYFQNSIRAHVRHRAFATLKIELYRVVDYDSKWSTKFYKDCIFDFFIISPLGRLMIILFNFQNSIRVHVWHRVFETLQIKLYCAVEYDSKWSTKIHKDCMLDVFVISLLRRLLIFKKNNSIRAHVEHTAFATLQIVVDYDNKWVYKFDEDCLLDFF